MALKIVSDYRRLYEENYMDQTLNCVPGVQFALNMYDDSGFGFPGSVIVLNFAGECHGKIWAANFVKKEGTTYHGYIEVNADLAKQKPELRKMILAEEWLEVMMGLRDKENGAMQKRIKDKVGLAVLFNSLKRRGFWQDSPGQQMTLHAALRLLLVSKESVEKMLAETFDESLDTLKQKVCVNPNDATKLISDLVMLYAATYTVNGELVWDRVMEILEV